jgi:hypothetical protein
MVKTPLRSISYPSPRVARLSKRSYNRTAFPLQSASWSFQMDRPGRKSRSPTRSTHSTIPQTSAYLQLKRNTSTLSSRACEQVSCLFPGCLSFKGPSIGKGEIRAEAKAPGRADWRPSAKSCPPSHQLPALHFEFQVEGPTRRMPAAGLAAGFRRLESSEMGIICLRNQRLHHHLR